MQMSTHETINHEEVFRNWLLGIQGLVIPTTVMDDLLQYESLDRRALTTLVKAKLTEAGLNAQQLTLQVISYITGTRIRKLTDDETFVILDDFRHITNGLSSDAIKSVSSMFILQRIIERQNLAGIVLPSYVTGTKYMTWNALLQLGL